MFVVALLSPKLMLKVSVFICLISTTIISMEGSRSANFLYVGASFFGFAISWAFGAGYAWTAEHMDVVVSFFEES